MSRIVLNKLKAKVNGNNFPMEVVEINSELTYVLHYQNENKVIKFKNSQDCPCFYKQAEPELFLTIFLRFSR